MASSSSPSGYFRDKQGKVHPLRSSGGGGGVDRFGTEDTLENNPPPVVNSRIRDIAQKYNKSAGLPAVKDFAPQALQPEEGRRLADAYESAKDDPNDEETKASYDAFHNEVSAQWDALTKAGIKFEPWEKPGQPYQTSTEMKQDVNQNGHLFFFKTGGAGNEPNSLTTNEQNDKFRQVHDIFGHAQMGNQFGPVGETNAYLEHAQMFSPKAIPALTSETLAQNSTYNFGRNNVGKPADMRTFPGQKSALVPAETYAGILGRRDSSATKSEFAAGTHEDDYFGCPCHKREKTALMSALKMAVQTFFTNKEGRRIHIRDPHSPDGISTTAHNAELMLIHQLKNNGGFTFHTHTGEQPSGGYSLSPYEDRTGIFPGTDVTTKDFHDYMAKNEDLLGQPDHFFGGWDDKNKSRTALDVSINVKTPEEAERIGRAHHQDAYYDVANDKDVYIDYGDKTKTSLFAVLRDAYVEFAGPPPGRLQHGSEGEKPKGFFRDAQGKVHPIGGSDGFSQGGSGQAIDPYPSKPTAKMQANAEKAFAEMGLTPAGLRATFEGSYSGGSDFEKQSGHSWYSRTNTLAGALAKHGNISLSSAAGAIAAMSPHNEFIRNLKDAKVAIDTINGRFRGRRLGRTQKDRDKYMRDKPITELTITPKMAQHLFEQDKKSKMKARASNALDVQHYNGIEDKFTGQDFTGTHRVQDLPGDVLAAFIPKMGGQRNMFATAMTIARGGDPNKYLGASGSNKVRSFYNNILDPDHDPYNSTTVDTHIIMEGRGKGRGGYGGSWVEGKGDVAKSESVKTEKKAIGKVFGNPALYKMFDDAIKDVSAKHGLRSHQGQAVIWNVHKNRGLEALGDQSRKEGRVKYGAIMSELVKYAAFFTGEDEENLGPGEIGSNPDTWTDEEYETIKKEDLATSRQAEKDYLANTGQKQWVDREPLDTSLPKRKHPEFPKKGFHQKMKDDLKKGPIRKALEDAIKAVK